VEIALLTLRSEPLSIDFLPSQAHTDAKSRIDEMVSRCNILTSAFTYQSGSILPRYSPYPLDSRFIFELQLIQRSG
jgi:hypothetical protein